MSIVYCYIRKNACTAFKRMLLDKGGYDGEWSDAIQFLGARYGSPSLEAARSAKWRVWVYRDPFDRAVSLFRNKMIQRQGAEDFLANFAERSGLDPKHATFHQFVTQYLTRRRLDPHANSQASHLLPIRYNSVIPIDRLSKDIERIVGPELAHRYFKQAVNSSSSSLFDEPSVDISVQALRERYRLDGGLPSSAALENAELRSVIGRVYRTDYRIADLNSLPLSR